MVTKEIRKRKTYLWSQFPRRKPDCPDTKLQESLGFDALNQSWGRGIKYDIPLPHAQYVHPSLPTPTHHASFPPHTYTPCIHPSPHLHTIHPSLPTPTHHASVPPHTYTPCILPSPHLHTIHPSLPTPIHHASVPLHTHLPSNPTLNSSNCFPYAESTESTISLIARLWGYEGDGSERWTGREEEEDV